ncbi:hypothetical protein D3C80_591370 [compost metagenome]
MVVTLRGPLQQSLVVPEAAALSDALFNQVLARCTDKTAFFGQHVEQLIAQIRGHYRCATFDRHRRGDGGGHVLGRDPGGWLCPRWVHRALGEAALEA